ncbi:tmk Thymidylate kinase [Methylophilaceae bacterium]
MKSSNPLAKENTLLKGVIAVVGCDGTGKSTITADLLTYLQSKGPAERRYLGLISGEMGDKIKYLPFVGVRLERNLAAKAERAQDMKQKPAGTLTSIIMHILSMWRVSKMKSVMRLSAQSILVVTDRYPQAEIIGFRYDGPGMKASIQDNWLLRHIAARELKLYQWMAQQKPALIIRLNIDAVTAHGRKPDHSMAELHDKIDVMPSLNYNGAKLVEIDARAPYSEVWANTLKAVQSALS